MKRQSKKKLISTASLFMAALIWGSSFFIVKNTVDVFPTNILLGIRFTVGFLLLALIFMKRFRQIDKGYIWRGALLGLFLFLGYCLQTIGLTDTTPGKNAFLTAVYCVLVPFLFWAVDRSRPDAYNILAASVCIAGIGLISLTRQFTIGFGDGLTLISGLFYAIHIVAVSKFGKHRDMILLTILQFGFAAIFSWILGLSLETFPTAVSLETIGGIAYLAVFATTLGLLLQNIGQKRAHPATASIILSLESVFGVAFSVAFYGEILTPKLAVGFLLVFLAVIISETKLSFLRRRSLPAVLECEPASK